ncbi:MAG: hypothetical protein WCW04_00625 [Candidatus Paceibacterota bacterium]|jgi:hypothetical protein
MKNIELLPGVFKNAGRDEPILSVPNENWDREIIELEEQIKNIKKMIEETDDGEEIEHLKDLITDKELEIKLIGVQKNSKNN